MLAASQGAAETYRSPPGPTAMPPMMATPNALPHGTSHGSSGRIARVDCPPSGANLRISPVSARLTYRLPAASNATLSGVSGTVGSNSVTVSTASEPLCSASAVDRVIAAKGTAHITPIMAAAMGMRMGTSSLDPNLAPLTARGLYPERSTR
jgi:hypothetical protein